MTTNTKIADNTVDKLFSIGAQYGYSRSRRHPSTGKYIFGVKNNVEIFDLTKTGTALAEALTFVRSLGTEGKTLLLVSGKAESKQAIEAAHEKTKLPYVNGRWIGGTLTNFEVIRKRVERLIELRTKQEKGGLEKYTKRERLMMRREENRLAQQFLGIIDMEKRPNALFVVDPQREAIAVHEAQQIGIPVVALASSDCDLTQIKYPIPANDTTITSIGFFVEQIASAYADGMKAGSTKTVEKKEKKGSV